MGPWASSRCYLNFAERLGVDSAGGYGEDAYARLQEIRSEVDPDGLFQSNQPLN
jgi:hypothetical protein